MASFKAFGAMKNGDWDTVKEMLERGELSSADVNDLHKYPMALSETLLTYGAAKGQLAIVEQLLLVGAHVESKNTYDYTALISSAMCGHFAVVELLLDRGAKVDAETRYGATALMLAALFGHRAVVRLLLDRGANLNARDKHGSTPLLFAAKKSQSDVIHLLQKESVWRRVRNFAQFLHMSGFASQQWSVRHPDPMESTFSIQPMIKDNSCCARGRPVVPIIQQANVLHNRDLCRIISAFIPTTSDIEG